MSRVPTSLPFALTVGVTGHRLNAIEPGARAGVEQAIVDALAMVEAAANALDARLSATGLFDGERARLTMLSPLADGADQFAARAALNRGWRLQAVLPFERTGYARDFEGEDPAETFAELLSRADGVLELPGDRSNEAESYLLAGRATVAHCGILVALWDGAPPRGRGGTAEVVHMAVSSGVPVVHISPRAGEASEVLWSGFDPFVLTRTGHDRAIRRPLDRDIMDRVLGALLSPPADPVEMTHLAEFMHERDHRYRGRVEFPLLLTASGVKKFRRHHWREADCVRAIDEEWRSFESKCAQGNGADVPLILAEKAYCRSDRLAGYYAQTFRSGHVFNFTMMATAALIGLTAFLFPGKQLWLAIAEFFVASAVIINTLFGTRREWQRRWLDYRQLAERLRPIRSLKLMGIASHEPVGGNTDPIPVRWVDWYANAIWRDIGCPTGRIDRDGVIPLVRAIREHEIDSQIAYNEHAAEQADLLDRRLGIIFNLLFVATVILSGMLIVGLIFAPEWVAGHQDWLTLGSAGLPAIAASIFGIRSQGDFAGSAQRSQATAQKLKGISFHLAEQEDDLGRAADLVEQAARAMLADLDEWRLVLKRSELEMA